VRAYGWEGVAELTEELLARMRKEPKRVHVPVSTNGVEKNFGD
jgi:hypothetical protein